MAPTRRPPRAWTATRRIRAAGDIESTTYALNLPATCSRCHADANVIAKGHIAIGNVGDLYKDSIHGRAITRSGLLVSANCTSCHGAHDIRKKTDAQSRVFRANIPSTCASCHGHPHAVRTRLARRRIGCGQRTAGLHRLHSAHAIQRADIFSGRWIPSGNAARATWTRSELTATPFMARSRPWVSCARRSVRIATALTKCIQVGPARSSLPIAMLATCRTCHANATAGFAGATRMRTRTTAIAIPSCTTHRAWHWLLIGVFGFFGLHAVLWRQKAWRNGAAGPSLPAESVGE